MEDNRQYPAGNAGDTSCEAAPAGTASYSRYALVLAGGEGRRAGGGLPKQFRIVAGLPLFWWSVLAFSRENPDTHIIIVLHSAFISEWNSLIESVPERLRVPVMLCAGGCSRLESVSNGLALVPRRDDVLVAVHDAARPLLTRRMIADGWRVAAERGGAVPVVPVTDSLRSLDSRGEILEESASHAVDRSAFVAVQTPQVFPATVLKDAYARPLTEIMTDDASVAEAAGHCPALFAGDARNIKVTNPADFILAEALLAGPDAQE